MKRLSDIAARERRRVVGLMSGTAADGIDAALVELRGCGSGTRFELLAFETVKMPERLRSRVLELCRTEARVEELCQVNFVLGEALAEAALRVIAAAGLGPEEVDLIGSHGQTVRHLPSGAPPSTLQIGESAVIAQRTGIATIADFRPADMALGGEGAPLVPLVDHLLFSAPDRGRMILNIGGIANVTVLPAGGGSDEVLAFDLGPGNGMIDAAVAHFTRGEERCDRDGVRAGRGKVDGRLLEKLMAHPFLDRYPPKSTGREEFGAEFVAEILEWTELEEEDLVATLTAFTARSIADGIRRFAPGEGTEELWVAGGGLHNPQLIEMIREELPQLQVDSLAGLGVDPDAREALTFAVLANETLLGRPGNLPSATGAERPAVLGKIALPGGAEQ